MNSPAEADLLRVRWFAQPNDLIGGWCAVTVNAPPSEGVGFIVADFITEATAKHIVALHNESLERR
jgi:hypothetical protein